MAKVQTLRKMWVGGKYVEASTGKTIAVINPATETILDYVPSATRADTEKAIRSANEAHPAWKQVSGVARSEMLHEVANRIKDMKEELARTLTLEGGKPLKENRDEIDWVAACFHYYAEVGRSYRGRLIPPIESSQISMVVKESYGVVVCIVPWNYPLLLASWKAAPALAAGNTVIIKPSSLTPLSTLALAQAFSLLPPGVVNILIGSGEEVGDTLVESAMTHVIAFTGSVSTGQHIAALAARRVKKVILELGGKDPFVICEDSNLDVAARAAAWAAFLNAGQVCTSAERIYVQEGVADEFTRKLVEFTETLRIGPGLEPATDVGPMISAENRSKTAKQVEEAVGLGATVVTGGKIPKKYPKGFYFEPTVVTGVNHRMALMQEETFGPVAPVMTYKDFDEALQLANDTIYGLGANIMTTDARKAKRFFEEVKSGTVWINDPLTDNDAGPFGGMKMSGSGRELGEEGIEEFWETKHVHWDFEQRTRDWWYPY